MRPFINDVDSLEMSVYQGEQIKEKCYVKHIETRSIR